MQLKYKIIVLTVLPLLLAVFAIGAIVIGQTQRLAEQQVAVMQDSVMAAKRAELEHNVSLALTSINHLYSRRDDDDAKAQAKEILRGMNYGDDGYFFVYDLAGNNLVHPRKPELVGRNLWNLKDPSGLPVIQRLIEAARRGGGFQQYQWEKPSTGQITHKLGYVVTLDRWGWMLGTGIYLDDLEAATSKIRGEVSANINATMWGLAIVALISVLGVFAAGLALNISDRRLADGKLKDLAQQIVTSQEEERARVSRELHDGISQLLVSTKYQFELVQHNLEEGTWEPTVNLEKGLIGLTDAISEVRRISHDLRPSVLDDLGLPAALEQLAKEFSQRTYVKTSVRARLPGHVLPEREAVTMFRIAQEAFTNIERHAHAKAVSVALNNTGASVQLSISDDGLGFAVENIDRSGYHGIGLRNIRERIEHHGGTLSLVSAPGHTELIASLPLTAAA